MKCSACGKSISGQHVRVVPPMFEVRLFGAQDRHYHPRCHAEQEQATDHAHDSAKDNRATGPGPGASDRGREDFPDTERERMRSL